MLVCWKRRKTFRCHMQRPNQPMQQRSTLPGSPARLHRALPGETLSFGTLKTEPRQSNGKVPRRESSCTRQPSKYASLFFFSSSIASHPQPHFSSPNFGCWFWCISRGRAGFLRHKKWTASTVAQEPSAAGTGAQKKG